MKDEGLIIWLYMLLLCVRNRAQFIEQGQFVVDMVMSLVNSDWSDLIAGKRTR